MAPRSTPTGLPARCRDLPVIIEIVDSEEKIRAALPEFDAMLEATRGGGLVTLEAAEIIKYTHGDSGA
jgi:PII-like signaling protein